MNYWPHGAPYFYIYGNTLWPVINYNQRLQPSYTYGVLNNSGAQFMYYFWYNWGTTNNNGNVQYIDEGAGNAVPWRLGPISVDGGIAIDVGLAGKLLGSGESSVQCPGNVCGGIGGNGQYFQISADANGNVFSNQFSRQLELNCTGESTDNYQCSWSHWSSWFVQGGDQTKYFGNIQQLFNGNQQLWKNSAGVGNFLGVATAAAVAAPIAIDALGSLATMDVAIGPGVPAGSHVAFGVNGTWLHATGDIFGQMSITADGAAAYATRLSWFRFGVPILYPGAVLGTAGVAESNCVTGACYAFLKGWGF